MSSDLSDYLNTLVKDGAKLSVNQLKKLISTAEKDSEIFIRHIAESAEEFIKMKAQGDLTDDEFQEVMNDLLDLNKMQYYKLSVEAKARTQALVTGLTNLLVKQLIARL